MITRRVRYGSLAVLALAGLGLTAYAMMHWVPDRHFRFPEASAVAERARADAEALGYRVSEAPAIQISAGPRIFARFNPYVPLISDIRSPEVRNGLMEAAPLVRLGARFATAVGPNGSTSDLVLEYDGDLRLVGASFGLDSLSQRGLAPVGGLFFADQMAENLLQMPPPMREDSGLSGGQEFVYRSDSVEPGAYVYLSNEGGWTAQLQPVPDFLVRSSGPAFWSWPPADQARVYIVGIQGALVLALLLWRLGERRAGLTQSLVPAILLAIGLLPIVGDFQVALPILLALSLLFLVPQLGVLAIWVVGEAEMREARRGSVEHWDRLTHLRPIQVTGHKILVGLAFGCILSGLLTSAGRIGQVAGAGYSSFFLVLPDYWILPASLNRGLLLAAATAAMVGFGGRIAGKPGGIIAGLAVGFAWSYFVPVAPIGWSISAGVLASAAAAWAVWWHGLLALTVACVTGLSLPVAWAAWSVAPHATGTALISSMPLLLLPLGTVIALRAPQRRPSAEIEPAYVASLENETRLQTEIELLRTLQLSLLPRESDFAGTPLDVAWQMIPAEEVGGDFLDLVIDDDERLWLAVADVAGHGLSCSLLTAYAKAAFAEHACAENGPAHALRRIRHLFRRLDSADISNTMMTMLIAVWDRSSGLVTVATAGHPPAPALRR